MRYSLLFLILLGMALNGQIKRPGKLDRDQTEKEQRPGMEVGDKFSKDSIFNRKRNSSQDSGKLFIPKITDYLYFSEKQLVKTPFDTALTIESFYKQNWIQKDWFGRMPFPNIGRPFNPLTYFDRQNNLSILPEGKSNFYIPWDEVRYYDVKTPTNEFVFENGVRDGQGLSTTFTHSVNRQFNYSFRYRGIRSQGRYQREISSNNLLIFGINYKTKNERFKLRSHYASHNIDNEENGGIETVEDFTNPGESITNTDNLPVNLSNTESIFDSRRFHLNGSYGVFTKINPTDSTKYQPVRLENSFTYEKQKYLYAEGSAENYYSSQTAIFSGLSRENLKSSENLRNTTTLAFQWGKKLQLNAGLLYQNVKVYANSALQQGLVNIPQGVEDNLIGAVANLNFDWNERINLKANGEYSRGDFFGNQYELNGELAIKTVGDITLGGEVLLNSKFPSLNLVYNQSFYQNFNYFNSGFKNLNTQTLTGKLSSKKFATSLQATATNLQNYVYVGADLRPRQLDSDLSLVSFQLINQLNYKKFHLRTTALYQEVTQNESYLPLPQFVGRASIWWQTLAFNKTGELQVGVNVNYFTGFKSRRFDPILNEFVLQAEGQNTQEIGDFPMFDVFFNLKVKRMRIYLRGDHINQLFSDQRNYFSAPDVPFREWKIQVGINWYLFS